MALEFIGATQSDESRYQVAERFVTYLETRVLEDARGDKQTISNVDPTGRYWLGRLGPKDFVTLPDERQDRLEPCAIGLRLRPQSSGPWSFTVTVRFCLWRRRRATDDGGLRWAWDKTSPVEIQVPITLVESANERIFAADTLAAALDGLGAKGLSAEVRVRLTVRNLSVRAIEVTFVNTSDELEDWADGRFFEANLVVEGLDTVPFDLESLPDSFRFDRRVPAYGINCGVRVNGEVFSTSDGPAATKARPNFWAFSGGKPDITFSHLAEDPFQGANALLGSFEAWVSDAWSESTLGARANAECWSEGMQREAGIARIDLEGELQRLHRGVALLRDNEQLNYAFRLMNKAMGISARGKYSEWRPFQLAFLIVNLECLVSLERESDVVDIVWFATGGGKTETYLGLLLTAAFLDRLRGKVSGVTAWSRFPLRMLSLQQTQRFSNALAAAEIVRREAQIPGDAFSLGFLVGGGATPNRISKEDADKIEDKIDVGEFPYKLLDQCPFCRERRVVMRFDRVRWKLNHHCSNDQCLSFGEALPIHVVDDEIWRVLPTIVIGTLDKAANISRHTGMRGLIASPKGLCRCPGHGYTYAPSGSSLTLGARA